MTRAEKNLRYYNKTRRKVHAGKLAPLCRQNGPIGPVVTCKTCLMVQKTRAVGQQLNEWEQKRLDAMFKKLAAEKSARWRARNIEKARESARRYHAKNADVLRITNRQWREKNRGVRTPYVPRATQVQA
jgi:hypothetical protein